MAYIGNNLTVQQYAPTITYFSGNASTTAFTLPYAVVSAAQIIVTVENVIQNPSSAFTVSGTTLTFTSAPPSGTNNIWVEYTSLQTTANALPAYPSVTGDLVTSGGQYAKGAFSTAYTDGIVTDYTTGLGRISVGSGDGLAFYNGGVANTEKMRLDSSGNLCIGTTSALAPLTVYNATNPYMAFGNTTFNTYLNQTSTDFHMYTNGAYPIRFGTNNTERMRIDSSGNVGIGAAPTSFGSSYTVLDLYNGTTGSYYLARNSTKTGQFACDTSGVRIGSRTNDIISFTINDAEQMRLDTSANLKFNSGYGSVATAYGCRAWVNFNGTGTVAIRASGNVSSITDAGVGDYIMNFTNAMPDANYSIGGVSDRDGNGQAVICTNVQYQTPSTTAYRFWVMYVGVATQDHIWNTVQIFR